MRSRQEIACKHCRELYEGSSTGEYDYEVATNMCTPEDLGFAFKKIQDYSLRNYDDDAYLAGVWVLIGVTIVVCIGIGVSKVIIERGDARIAEDMRRRSERRHKKEEEEKKRKIDEENEIKNHVRASMKIKKDEQNDVV